MSLGPTTSYGRLLSGFALSTTARIEPKSLIPKGHAGRRVESKMVDFAIYTEPDEAMIEAMRLIAARDPYVTTSLNQTNHAPLRTRPVSVNIETKLTGHDWNKATVQVAIWVAAQFSKLEQLAAEVNKDIGSLPFLPLIIVQGHDWTFLAATRGRGRETVRTSGAFSLSSSLN